MAYSSILGADTAPGIPGGRDSELLGPSDNSDSGSDSIGTSQAHADSDAVGTGERGSVTPDGDSVEGSDIRPDRVVNLADGKGSAEVDPDTLEFTDIDAGADGMTPDSAGQEDGD